jgi:superfamily II DNA or RNA helicase
MDNSTYKKFKDFIDNSNVDDQLRDYQKDKKNEIYSSWEKCDNVMLQMPTGTGKTRLFVSICKDILNFTKTQKSYHKVLVLAHRKELIDQISDNLGEKYGIGHGKIVAGGAQNLRLQFQVASIQTLFNRREQIIAANMKFDFIIIDEAHHATAKTYRKILESFQSGKVLGVTATPVRMGREGFNEIFQKLIISPSIKEFIDNGTLSEYIYYSIKQNNKINKILSSLNKFALDGDYLESELVKRFDIGSIRAKLVDSYKRYANGKKGIVYTINVEHNQNVRQNYEDAGYTAKAIDANTSSIEREDIIKKFKLGEIQILCNVNIFSEGFDCPDIEFIQLARPTKSLAMFLQQIGRGLRKHEDIEKTIFLDNVGLYYRFGLPSSNRKWAMHFVGRSEDIEEENEILQEESESTIFKLIEEGNDNIELIEESNVVELSKFSYFSKDQSSLYFYYFPDSYWELNNLEDKNKNEDYGYYDLESFCEENHIFHYNDLSLVNKNGKVGLIDNDKIEILPIVFDEIEFSDFYGISIIKKNNKKGIFDCFKRKILLEPNYDEIILQYSQYTHKFLIFKTNDKYGVYNYENREFLCRLFFKVLIFHELIHCIDVDQWITFDLSFKEIDKQLITLHEFGEHKFAKYQNNYGKIVNGKLIFPFVIEDIISASNYCFLKINKEYKLYDYKIDVVFEEGIYAVEKVKNIWFVIKNFESKKGLLKINKDKIEIELQTLYTEIIFEQNYLIVRYKNFWQIIENGIVVSESYKKMDAIEKFNYSKNNQILTEVSQQIFDKSIEKEISCLDSPSKENEKKSKSNRDEFIITRSKNVDLQGEKESPRLTELYAEFKKTMSYFEDIFRIAQIEILLKPSTKFTKSVYDFILEVIKFDNENQEID